MIAATFRPMPMWPHGETRSRRWHPFSASWSNTLDLLDRELRHLRGRSIIIAARFREQDLRLDGWPRSGTPEPEHPGVEVSFDSKHGRLIYATDVCSHWQDNVRSIALGLGALRAVDRYGVSRRGEQYAGWKALPGVAEGRGVVIPNTDRAWEILFEAADLLPGDKNPGLDATYRMAAKRTHPDHGGDGERFIRVQAAYEFLKRVAA
jgi:hypothetical protein